MNTELTIHCVGLEGLTITAFGADHSIPLTADVIRVTTLLGSTEYTIHRLPVTYNLSDLNGNLSISDISGKALYRWRLHPPVPSSVAGHEQSRSQPTDDTQGDRRSPSLSAPPSYRTAETPPTTGSIRALNHVHNDPNASSVAGVVAEDPMGTSLHAIFLPGFLIYIQDHADYVQEMYAK